MRDVDDGPLLLAYAPRGVGMLWASRSHAQVATAGVLGTTRSAMLAALALPATTRELAAVLGLAPSTVSEHLQALHDARLVTRQRRGRMVRHARTPIADAWLATGRADD